MEFYKLFNSGTSEGAKTGWETRKAGAQKMSTDAEKASAAARMSGPVNRQKYHFSAATYHEAAAAEHEKLAQGGPQENAKYHSDKAEYHTQKGLDHRAASMKAGDERVAELRKYAHDNDPEQRKERLEKTRALGVKAKTSVLRTASGYTEKNKDGEIYYDKDGKQTGFKPNIFSHEKRFSS